MSNSKRRWKDIKPIQNDIHQILINEWDPIGVAMEPEAQAEYDCYIGGIHSLLNKSADKTKIVSHLRQLEMVDMGLSECDDVKREHVAEILLKLVDKKAT